MYFAHCDGLEVGEMKVSGLVFEKTERALRSELMDFEGRWETFQCDCCLLS
jgi:hypothetical protein